MCNVMCSSLKGHIFVVSVQHVIGTGIIKCRGGRFVNSANRRRESKTLYNINEERSERKETTYKFLMCEDFL